jgi:hypothetical protein
MDISFPSPDFPGPPSFTLAVPDGWVLVDLPDAVVAAADPASPEGSATNLLVTVSRVVGEHDLASLVAHQVRTATGDLGGVLDRQQHEPIAGEDAIWSAFTFPQVTHRPVPTFQAQAALLLPRREGVSDLVTLVATCAATLAPHYSPLFRATFLSLALAD